MPMSQGKGIPAIVQPIGEGFLPVSWSRVVGFWARGVLVECLASPGWNSLPSLLDIESCDRRCRPRNSHKMVDQVKMFPACCIEADRC